MDADVLLKKLEGTPWQVNTRYRTAVHMIPLGIIWTAGLLQRDVLVKVGRKISRLLLLLLLLHFELDCQYN